MSVRAVLSIALLALAGCSTLDTDTTSGDMAKDSEFCRADVVASLVGRGGIKGTSTQEQYASFDKAYRSCMQAKGYDLKS